MAMSPANLEVRHADHADEVRERIMRQTGNSDWATRLVPVQPEEQQTLARARLLRHALTQQLRGPPAPLVHVRPASRSVTGTDVTWAVAWVCTV